MDLTEEQKRIIQDLRIAFAAVPYPGDDRISDGCPCSECEEVKSLFAGRHWQDHLESPYQLLGYFPPREPALAIGRDFLPHLRVEALHFFLPLFLAAVLVDPEEADVLTDSVRSSFDPGPQPHPGTERETTWRWRLDRCTKLLSFMTGAQRESTTVVLKPFAARDECLPPKFADVLENLDVGKCVAWKKYDSPWPYL